VQGALQCTGMPLGTTELPLLNELSFSTIVFVTNRRPSAAIALAARFNPAVNVRVLTPSGQRERVRALGGSWSDLSAHDNRSRAFTAIYRQGAIGPRDYWRFCHSRWISIAADLQENPPLAQKSAVAVMDDDVLLFEAVESRLREAGQFHREAQAETVVNGAFVLASAGVLARFASFLWWLYSLPLEKLGAIVWTYGEPKKVGDLNLAQRGRLDPVFVRGQQYAQFTDMHAIDAFRFLSRAAQLPPNLRVRWAAGHRRSYCTALPRLPLGHEVVSTWVWRDGVPHSAAVGQPPKPLCFVHLQGPAAKQKMAQILQLAGHSASSRL